MNERNHPLALAGLPPPAPAMNWRALHAFKDGERGAAFYLTCLQYAQHLWLQSLPARAILCLDRAWCADLTGDEAVLLEWPLPYQPLFDLMRAAPEGAFLGNPRVHFQHYADRLGPPRQELRKWRAWAGWAVACHALPDLPGDPRHLVATPSLAEIETQLAQRGLPGEAALWRRVIDAAPPL